MQIRCFDSAWQRCLVWTFLVSLPQILGFNQNRAELLLNLDAGNCSSPAKVEVIGAGTPYLNGIYDSSPQSVGSTTASCFSWIDQSKPYYVLNRTSGCNQEGLIDLYHSGTYWKISANGIELYEAYFINGPWTPLNSIQALPPTFVICYGQCDLPTLVWKVKSQNMRLSAHHARKASCANTTHLQNVTAREDVTAWTGGLGVLMNDTFQVMRFVVDLHACKSFLPAMRVTLCSCCRAGVGLPRPARAARCVRRQRCDSGDQQRRLLQRKQRVQRRQHVQRIHLQRWRLNHRQHLQWQHHL